MANEERIKPPVNPFTEEEIQVVCDAIKAKDAWYYHYFMFALHTGMRRSEILALTWHDVDLWQHRQIRVPNLKNPHLDGNFRHIPINETVLGLLLDLRSPSRWIFHKTGKRMLGGTVTLFFTELSRSVGIQITSERTRWTFAMSVFKQIAPSSSKDWKELQKMLGHKDQATTVSYFQRHTNGKLSPPR